MTKLVWDLDTGFGLTDVEQESVVKALFDREINAAAQRDETVRDVVERFRSKYGALRTVAFCLYLESLLPRE